MDFKQASLSLATHPKETLAASLEALNGDIFSAEAWECIGSLLLYHKKWDEARKMLALAVKTIPDNALLHAYYSHALAKTGELEAAWAAANEALRLQPNLDAAHLAKTEILCEAGRYDLALQESRHLQNGNQVTAAFCRGSMEFITGNHAYGMELLTKVINSGWRGKNLPEWNGDPVPDRHVILYAGQGFGDIIQFVRYVPIAASRAGKITLHVTPNMARLMSSSFPQPPIAVSEEENSQSFNLPENIIKGVPQDVTLRCSFSTLATFTENGFTPFAEAVPYLRPDEKLRQEWRERLRAVPRPRIGLTWAGTWYSNNPQRSLQFENLQPLIEIAKPHLVSLQLGPQSRMAADAGLFDASPFIHDFADSAALMSELDLVITLDSAPAHLAGALGRPVWTLLPFNADWRWLIGREDSIWYPTMRLIRQSHPHDWSDVIATVCEGAARYLQGDGNVLKPMPWTGRALRRHPNALQIQGILVDSAVIAFG